MRFRPGLQPSRNTAAADGAGQGIPAISGVEMFVYQGARQFEIWTGKPAPVEAMRGAVLRQLGVRGPILSTAPPRPPIERAEAPQPTPPAAPPAAVAEKPKAGAKANSGDGLKQKKPAPAANVKTPAKATKSKAAEKPAAPAVVSKNAPAAVAKKKSVHK